jgi:hypothetical protein
LANDSAIRSGLKTRLETISGLTVYKFVPGQINVPAAIVQRRRTGFDAVMAAGADDWEYVATLLVGWADPEVAQATMSDFLARTGATSVKAAIEGDETLGAVVDFAHVREAGEEEIRQYNDIPYLAVDFTIEVTG